MKLKNDYVTHVSGNQHVLISTGDDGFSGLVRSNTTAAFIIEQMKSETTKEKIVDALLREYDVDRERASVNVEKVIQTLRNIGALDE